MKRTEDYDIAVELNNSKIIHIQEVLPLPQENIKRALGLGKEFKFNAIILLHKK
jgi:hypothetical protein